MPEFQTPVDIGNRALQRVGAQLIGSAGFTELSLRASAVSFCYGKLRRAELGRNLWGFATKSAALRPIDSNTMLLTPTLWSSSVTYFFGSIVQDQAGTYWESIQRDNLNNLPGNAPAAWIPYFGPLTAEPFDSSKGYFASELVYTISGDGTFNVYKSRISGNTVHPALPNQWSVNTIYSTDDVVQQFPAWASGTTYAAGQGALYTDGNVYVSLVAGNLNHIPPSSGTQWALLPVLTLSSQLMPTSLFVAPALTSPTPIDEWNIKLSYSIGSFVIQIGNVYVSLVNANVGNVPSGTPADWAQVTNGALSQSLIDGNQNNSPVSSPAAWSSGTTYASGNQVAGTDGNIYTSVVNSNLNHNPVTDNGSHWTNTMVLVPWTTVFTLGGGNSQWLQVGGSAFPGGADVAAFNVNYPVGTGPFSQTWTRNIYRLPANYLRRAPQMPAAGRSSWLGFPGNLTDTDWEYDGDFLTTWDSNPIVLRFVADVQDVSKFPDLFCEGLACRIAVEVCETLTQSTAKVKVVEEMYIKFMTEARIVGGIEVRATEPPLDDFIACRI